MADLREQILARLAVLCAAVTGVVAVARNRTDVPLTQRPAVLVNGGAEQMLSSPRPAARFSQVQLMELTPGITLLVRSEDADAGALMSLFRGRLVNAILSDATLRGIVSTNGAIRYDGCNEVDPTPESKEPRLELQIVFVYPLRLADLA